MKKYNKVNENQVLKEYHNFLNGCNEVGLWVDYVSVELMAYRLKTSKYQIRKIYKELKEKELMEIEKFPTYCEEYDNGLYTVDVPILYSKVYTLSKKGEEYIKELIQESEDK